MKPRLLSLLTLCCATAAISCKQELQQQDEALHGMLNNMYDDYVTRYGSDNVPGPLLIKATRSGLSQRDSLSIIKMDTLFTKQDLTYIFEQAKDTTAIMLNPALLKGKSKVISRQEIENFWKKCNSDNYRCWQVFEKHYGQDGILFTTSHYLIKSILLQFYIRNIIVVGHVAAR